VQGTTDPAVLADLARGRLRTKLPALQQALAGRFRDHHAFLLGQILAHVDYLDEAVTTLSGGSRPCCARSPPRWSGC
jgi:transposase